MWDYPRPPLIEPTADRIQVWIDGDCLADTTGAFRLCETSHPPVYYLPPCDIRMERLAAAPGGSFCEWKGRAHYHSYQTPSRQIAMIAWSYPTPTERFAALAGFLAFYPSKVDRAQVAGEVVTAQPGDFYGGWITSKVVGPFKGSPGTMGW